MWNWEKVFKKEIRSLISTGIQADIQSQNEGAEMKIEIVEDKRLQSISKETDIIRLQDGLQQARKYGRAKFKMNNKGKLNNTFNVKKIISVKVRLRQQPALNT